MIGLRIILRASHWVYIGVIWTFMVSMGNIKAQVNNGVYSKIEAISGQKKHLNAVGKRCIFLPSATRIFFFSENYKVKKKLVAVKGEISSFIIDGNKYQAYFNNYSQFYGYFDSSFNVYRCSFIHQSKTYLANSLQTFNGRDDSLNYPGAFHGISEFTQKDMAKVLIDFNEIYRIKYNSIIPFWAVLAESVEGAYDYKYTIYDSLNIHSEDLLLINGVVYNANEAGNYIWAMCLEYYHFKIDANILAMLGSYSRDDEYWEQRAIYNGKRDTKRYKKIIVD